MGNFMIALAMVAVVCKATEWIDGYVFGVKENADD